MDASIPHDCVRNWRHLGKNGYIKPCSYIEQAKYQDDFVDGSNRMKYKKWRKARKDYVEQIGQLEELDLIDFPESRGDYLEHAGQYENNQYMDYRAPRKGRDLRHTLDYMKKLDTYNLSRESSRQSTKRHKSIGKRQSTHSNAKVQEILRQHVEEGGCLNVYVCN